MKIPQGESRLSLIRKGLSSVGAVEKRGRLVVGIDRLVEDLHNERKTFRNMEGLIASVKAVGLVEPITVMPLGKKEADAMGGKYQIITGHRRYRAARAAGLKEVEVIIREPEDELTRRQKSVISNVQREDVGPVEMAEALQALMEEDERIQSQDDLAKMIGKDKTWVSGMLRILTLPIQLQGKVGLAQQSVSYDAMIRIARLDEPRQQAELVDALLGGASKSTIRHQIDIFKGKEETEEDRPTSGTKPESNPKPKRVYHTSQHATVIVQSDNQRLSGERVEAALLEALRQARK